MDFERKTFHIITFGCQMNANDSAWLGRALAARGFQETGPEEARVFVINTCSVREKPELKVYSQLGRLRKYADRDEDVFVAVGGCVAQQLGGEFFKRFPFVRLVFGADGTSRAPGAIETLCREPGRRISLVEFQEDFIERPAHIPSPVELAEAEVPPLDSQAFVTIMQGCDNFCAYCIVPYVRGRQKSRQSEAILEECRALIAGGVREITLLGQNVNSYGKDKHGDGVSFSELLHRVAGLPGLGRLRFTTSHPKDIADDVIEAFGRLPNLCPQLHLPMQSGSDAMLKAMGRKYTMARYRDIVARLRRARPDIGLSTDIIVGFPGESEEDFQATMRAVEEIGFSSSFSFIYSDRPGVRAERLPDKIPDEVKSERLARFQALQNTLTRDWLAGRIGRDCEVILEGVSKFQPFKPITKTSLYLRGRDAHNQVVNVAWNRARSGGEPALAGAPELAGKFVTARILEAKKHSLLGETVGEPW